MTEALSLAFLRGGFRVLGKTAPAIASRVAFTLFTTPRRYAAPERETEALQHATAMHIPFEGMRLRAWRWGDGPAVLLVHGWEGRGAQMAAFVPPLVDAGMSVVTYDAPAHGRSSGTRTTLPQFAAAVRAVADGIGPVRGIVAHSFGCAAVTLALHDGFDVERLVFVAPPVDPETYTRRFGEVLRLDTHVLDGMKERIERRFHRRWSDYSVEKNAVRMTAPLLVIHDEDDREIAIEESRRIVDSWPASRLLVTSGLGHRRVLRDESVIRTVAGFLGTAR